MAGKMKPHKPAAEEIVDILQVTQGEVTCCLVGEKIILNRMSEKAKRELLMPRGRLTSVEKLTHLKHNPRDEFRSSPYTLADDAHPTLLAFPATGFKGSMGTAALDLPGARKAQVGRLTYVIGDFIHLYGVPKLLMSGVISAGMNKTPDIRTRAIVAPWACQITVRYVQPIMRPQAVVNLIAAAGICVGVGDWRLEKGKGNYGLFRIVSPTDPEYLAIVRSGGRAVQHAAMANPEAYDDESADLLAWFDSELERRRRKGVGAGPHDTDDQADRIDHQPLAQLGA